MPEAPAQTQQDGAAPEKVEAAKTGVIGEAAPAVAAKAAQELSDLLRFRRVAEKVKESKQTTLRAVQIDFERYKDKYNIVILAPTAIPPDYFQGFVHRNPITGCLSMSGVEPEFDFWFVDLLDRPYVCDVPPAYNRDKYVFKATILEQRTWAYQMLIKQLDAARMGNETLTAVSFQTEQAIHETTRDDCALLALSHSMGTKTQPSSFKTLMFVTFIIAFSKSFPLIIYTAFISCISLYLSKALNVPILFRYTRLIDAPFRILFLLIMLLHLGSETNVIALLSVAVALCYVVIDLVQSDISTLISFSSETRFEVLKTMGEKAWLVKSVKTGGRRSLDKYSVNMDGGGAVAPLPRFITGSIPDDISEADCILVVDICGLLCRLDPVDSRAIEQAEVHQRVVEDRLPKEVDILNHRKMKKQSESVVSPLKLFQKKSAAQLLTEKSPGLSSPSEGAKAGAGGGTSSPSPTQSPAKGKGKKGKGKKARAAVAQPGQPQSTLNYKLEQHTCGLPPRPAPSPIAKAPAKGLNLALARKARGLKALEEGSQYKPMMLNCVQMPLFNQLFPTQLHKESLFQQRVKK